MGRSFLLVMGYELLVLSGEMQAQLVILKGTLGDYARSFALFAVELLERRRNVSSCFKNTKFGNEIHL